MKETPMDGIGEIVHTLMEERGSYDNGMRDFEARKLAEGVFPIGDPLHTITYQELEREYEPELRESEAA